MILFLLIYHTIAVIMVDTESCYNQLFQHKDKPADWLSTIPQKMERSFNPSLLPETFFLIENTDENMTVGLRDIGLPGYFANCRVYDLAMLVHPGAKTFFTLFKQGDQNKFQEYVNDILRDSIIGADPAYFIIPAHFTENQLNVTTEMYKTYLETHMELLKTTNFDNKKINYYAKKNLIRRFTRAEIIRKYERIIAENPGYPAFKKRLNIIKQLKIR
jgi:hypothetical protein